MILQYTIAFDLKCKVLRSELSKCDQLRKENFERIWTILHTIHIFRKKYGNP